MAFSSNDPALQVGMDEFGFGSIMHEVQEDPPPPPNAPKGTLKAKNFDKRGTTVYTCQKNTPRTDEFRLETVCGVSPRVPVFVSGLYPLSL